MSAIPALELPGRGSLTAYLRPVAILLLTLFLGIFGLSMFGGPVAEVINEATRIDAAGHISAYRCGQLGPYCPGELTCYDDFDPDRLDVEDAEAIRGQARCVTPSYAERYCGALEAQVTVHDASIPSLGDCRPLTPADLLTDPGRVLLIPVRLLDRPSAGTESLRQANATSLADEPSSIQDPRTHVPCQFASIAVYGSVEYSISDSTIVFSIVNPGVRDINVTAQAGHGNTTIASLEDTHLLTTGGRINVTMQVPRRPDQVTVLSTDCPDVRETTRNITEG